jgi:transposase, IS5 family
LSSDELERAAETTTELKGKLVLDATCTPADIAYPTDLRILNEGREQTEKVIDILYKPLKKELKKKPRTYRKRARKNY